MQIINLSLANGRHSFVLGYKIYSVLLKALNMKQSMEEELH